MSMSSTAPLSVRVWGDLACFTRPELKAERMTYPVLTPTAAQGILEAIFWKPEFTWVVRQIDVLKPIRYTSVMRNEVDQRASPRVDHIDVTEVRTQRHAVILRDVAYAIEAEIALRSHATDAVAKYRDQFRRRVERGQCAFRPYLGCREFAAFFEPAEPDEPRITDSVDLGPMIADATYVGETGARSEQRIFHARLESGRLRIPLPEGR